MGDLSQKLIKLSASHPHTSVAVAISLSITTWNEKSAQRRRNHYTLAVVRRSQNFCHTTDPLFGGAGWPKFNQLEMVTTFIYRPSLVRIDASNFELSW